MAKINIIMKNLGKMIYNKKENSDIVFNLIKLLKIRIKKFAKIICFL